MNKIPLSLAAMAAVSVSAAAQDATPKTYDDLIRDISLLTQKVANYSDMYKASRDSFLVQIADVQTELNTDWTTNGKLTKGEKYYSDKIDEIDAASTTVNSYYVEYKSLEAAYNELAALKTRSDETAGGYSSEFANYKKEQLKALKIEEIGTKIKAFKNADGYIANGNDLLAQSSSISASIKEKTSAIEELMKDIDKKAATYDSNVAAKAELDGMVAAARESYTKELAKIVELLSGNDVKYDVWYEKAKKEMASAANKVDEAEKLGNVKPTDAGLVGYADTDVRKTVDVLLSDAAVIVSGDGDTPSVFGKYEALVGAYTAALEEVNAVKKEFDAYEKALDGSGMLDENKNAVDGIKGDIDALIALLNNNALTEGKENVAAFDIAETMAGINSRFGELKNKTQSIVDNFNANQRVLKVYNDLIEDFDKAIKDAKEALSADKAYNAGDHFLVTEKNIKEEINNKLAEIAQSFENKTSVADESGYTSYVNNNIKNRVDAYKARTAASLEAYNTAHKPVEDISEALGKLTETVGSNTLVPILLDGYAGKTYGNVLDAVNGDIAAINTAIAEANKKDGQAHLAAMQKITLGIEYTADQLTALSESFAADKAHYDKQVTIDAAGILKDMAERQLNALFSNLHDLLSKTNSDACGDAQAEALMEALNAEVEKIGDEIDDLYVEYEKIDAAGADPEKSEEENFNAKHAAAALFSNHVSKLNGRITEYKENFEDLRVKLEKATNSYTNYKSLTTQLGTISTAIQTQRDYITEKTGDYGQEGLAHFTGVLDGYEETYTTAIENLEKDLENVVCGEADALVKKGDLDALKKNIDAVKDAVDKNNEAHKKHVENYEKSVGSLDELYNRIQKEDQTDGATARLAEIESVRATTLKELKDKIEAALAAGESDGNKEIAALVEKITEVVKRLGAEIIGDEYINAMIATNEAHHNRFVAAYEAANATFAEAVSDLSLFASITDEDLKEALADLLGVHNDIYGYVEKLRKLYNDEFEAYSPYMATGDKKGELYEVGVWINTANDYKAEISEKMETYRNSLNQAAQNLYNSRIVSANNAISAAKAELAGRGYSETVQEMAYTTISADVQKATEIAGLLGGGNNTLDPMFAYKVQSYLATLNTIADLIAAENDVLANEEWNYRKREAETKIQWEAERLGEFAPGTIVDPATGELKVSQERIDNAKTLNAEQKASIGVAFEKYMQVEPAQRYETLSEMLGNLPQFTVAVDVDGKSQLQTEEFAGIYNDLFADGENAKAYEAIFALVAGAHAGIAGDVEFINSFFAAHTSPSTAADALANITGRLTGYLQQAERGYKSGNCAAVLAAAKGYCENTAAPAPTIGKEIADLREMMISIYEKQALTAQVVVLKGMYNEVVAQDLTKDYEELEKAINALPQKITDVFNTYNKVEDADAVAAAQVAAQAGYLEIEAEIAALYKTLTDLDNSKADAHDKAMEALDGANGGIEALLATVDGWFAEFEAIRDLTFSSPKQAYGEAVDNVKASLDAVKENIAAVDAAGSLLFYKDNILNDIAGVKAALDNIVGDGGLEAAYNKYKANKTRYEALTAEVGELTAELAKVYETVMAYEEAGVDFRFFPVYDEDGNVRYEDYRVCANNRVAELIAASVAELEAAYADIALTDDDVVANKTAIVDDTKALLVNATYRFAKQRVELRQSDIRYVQYKLDASNSGGSNKTQRYLDSVRRELQSATWSLGSVAGNLYEYNEDAKWNGVLGKDIDGNVYVDEEGNPAPVTLAGGYMDVASEIEAKYQELKTLVAKLVEDAESRWYYVGDANADGLVNVADYNIIRRYILDPENCTYEKLGEREAAGADLNGDKEINVSDLTCVSNLIFRNDWAYDGAQYAPAARVQNADVISLAAETEETTVFGKNMRLAVNLDNTVDYVAYQMDIRLPEGMRLTGESLTARSNGHELMSADIDGGMHRVLVSMMENNAFESQSGAVLYLDVEVNGDYRGGDIELANVIFTDAEGRGYSLNGLSTSSPTGIDTITAPTVTERIYSVGGRMMKAVKKGVNIIVGSDGSTKKVFNK